MNAKEESREQRQPQGGCCSSGSADGGGGSASFSIATATVSDDDEFTTAAETTSAGSDATTSTGQRQERQHCKRSRSTAYTVASSVLVVVILLTVGVALGVVFTRRREVNSSGTIGTSEPPASSSRTADDDSETGRLNDMNSHVAGTTNHDDSSNQEGGAENATAAVIPVIVPPPDDDHYRSLGVALDSFSRGTYLTDELLATDYSVSVAAAAAAPSETLRNGGYPHAGYTPDSAARVFDTAAPIGAAGWGDGDYDLGSPHVSCGGPGRGYAGTAGEPYENCVPLGNVLIIQETDKATPDDYDGGGTITFTFAEAAAALPVELLSVTLLNVMCFETATVTVTDAAGDVTVVETPDCIGTNGVYRMPVHVQSAVQVEVWFSSAAAVADMEYRV